MLQNARVNHVTGSVPFHASIASYVAVHPNCMDATAKLANETATAAVDSVTRAPEYQARMAQSLSSQPIFVNATTKTASDTATRAATTTFNNLMQSGDLTKAVGDNLMLNPSFIDQLNTKLQQSIKDFKETVTSLQASAGKSDPETSKLLVSLLAKVGTVAQVQQTCANLRNEFDDLKTRLVSTDTADDIEKKQLWTEMELVRQNLEAKLGEMETKVGDNKTEHESLFGDIGKDIEKAEKKSGTDFTHFNTLFESLKGKSKCMYAALM